MKFPNFIDEKFTGAEGYLTDTWRQILMQLFQTLQGNFSAEGVTISQQDTANIGLLNTSQSTGSLLYNSDINKLMVNILHGANHEYHVLLTDVALDADAPMVYDPLTGVFSLPAADAKTDGYLKKEDWTNFSDAYAKEVSTWSAPLQYATGTASITKADAITDGYLTQADWSTFNNKEPAIAVGTALQYWRGDKTWQTLDTKAVPENTNLYFTTARARGSLSGTAPVTYSTSTGAIGMPASSTTVNGYLSSAYFGAFLNATKTRSVFYRVTSTSRYRTYRPTITVPSDGECAIYFHIPLDFSRLVQAYVIFYVGAGADGPEKTFDVRNQYTFREGELYNTYTNGDTVVCDLSRYLDCRFHLDVTRIFEPLKPDAEGGIRIRQSSIGGNIYYMGVTFVYDI
jgi:hypothetical protein